MEGGLGGLESCDGGGGGGTQGVWLWATGGSVGASQGYACLAAPIAGCECHERGEA